MKIVVIDTETGGFEPEVHSLLSVGIYFPEDDSKSKLLYHSFPTYVVTPQAMSVNKLDLSAVQCEGITTDSIIGEIETLVRDEFIFIGHNIQFDARFLASLYPPHFSAIMRRHIDTKALALNLKVVGKLPEDLSTSLDDLATYFRLDTSNHHDALFDCKLTYQVWLELNKL